MFEILLKLSHSKTKKNLRFFPEKMYLVYQYIDFHMKMY